MPDQDPPRPDPAEPTLPAEPRHGRPQFGRPQFEHFRHALGGDDELPIDPDLEPDDARAPSPSHHPHAAPVRPTRGVRILASVFAGGALGTLARYAVETAWPQRPGHFPTATFVVNTAGAFFLGMVLTVLFERLPSHGRGWRSFLCTGVLGGWTTYSSLVVETDTLAKTDHIVVAAGYLAITLVCGIVAVALGIGLVRARIPGVPPSPPTGLGGAGRPRAPANRTSAGSRAR